MEYWHSQVKGYGFPVPSETPGPSETIVQRYGEYWEKMGRIVLHILEEYLEQVRHSMLVEELRARW